MLLRLWHWGLYLHVISGQEEKAQLLRRISEAELELADRKCCVVTKQDILSLARVRATNNLMRETRFDQEMAFARLQAMLYKHTVGHVHATRVTIAIV